MFDKKCYLVFFLAAGLMSGCGNNSAPLDAETRSRIDSIANAHVALAQKKYDSLCIVAQTTVLPGLVDSLKKERLREIQEQLKTIPK
ncbi:MAG TPA: hypothetical protein DCF33_11890 [Saprospirales bacterium]|nr:hypothetical protein [Saprospirales bacterium]